jgi:cell shape-determining protein MreD
VTGARLGAAAAAAVTAVLLQGALIGPLTAPWPVSLPAVMVASTALRAGPATGMVFGFSLGLVADLAGDHRVGALALAWLLLGVVAGSLGEMVCAVGPTHRLRSVKRALAVGLLCGVATLLAIGLGSTLDTRAALAVAPAAAIDAGLAAVVLPLVTRTLRSPALRPAPALGGNTR